MAGMTSSPQVVFRRAVLGTVMSMSKSRSASGPVSVTEIVGVLAATGLVDPVSPKRVADVLGHQSRAGRVRRVRRGVYEVVPGAYSRTTIWRCVNWRRSLPEPMEEG